MNFALRILAIWIGALVLMVLVAIATILAAKEFQNWRYAREFFEDKVEITRVIGSKRWLDFKDGGMGCTFAVVQVSETTVGHYGDGPPLMIDPEPGTQTRSRKDYRNRQADQRYWIGNWRATPVPDELWPMRQEEFEGSRLGCLSHLPANDARQIESRLKKEGSWYRVYHGEIFGFYSAEGRVAGVIRFGD